MSDYRALSVDHDYIDAFKNIDEWNHYVFYNLWKHVDTEFMLLIHEDGFVVNPHKWRKEFLQYDYCGSTWDIPTALAIKGNNNYEGELIRVGNSVSIRSRRLMKLPSEIGIEWKPFNGTYNEDTMICCHQRKHFVNRGMMFAPVNVSVYFGREHLVPEGKNIEPFIFHKYHNPSHPNWKYPRL